MIVHRFLYVYQRVMVFICAALNGRASTLFRYSKAMRSWWPSMVPLLRTYDIWQYLWKVCNCAKLCYVGMGQKHSKPNITYIYIHICIYVTYIIFWRGWMSIYQLFGFDPQPHSCYFERYMPRLWFVSGTTQRLYDMHRHKHMMSHKISCSTHNIII